MIAMMSAQIILLLPFDSKQQIFRNAAQQIFRNHHRLVEIVRRLCQSERRSVRLPQTRDDRVAAGEANRARIGVELHLPAQGEIRQVNDIEQQTEKLAQDPHHGREAVSENSDAQVEAFRGIKQFVKPVASKQHVQQDAVHLIDVLRELRRPLAKVAELMRKHRLELGHVERGYQPRADQ
jgi:hypothetical protein